MKELEVKEMLADERIPEQYKRGGRLSSEFLDGVDYAEQRIMEGGKEVWLARDEDGWLGIFNDEPSITVVRGIAEWVNKGSNLGSVHFDPKSLNLPEVTIENSPKKARIILED